MQFKFDWNKTIYKNICANTTILKSKVPWLDRQNITSISSKTHDLKETNALIQTLPCTVIMMLSRAVRLTEFFGRFRFSF